MRHHARPAGDAALSLWLLASALAAEPVTGSGEPTAISAEPTAVSGFVGFNLHLGTTGCEPATAGDCALLDLQDLLVAGARADGALGAGVEWRLAGIVRLRPGLDLEEAGEAADVARIQPWSLEAPEAWIELERVLVPAFDVRVGQQRFAWGVAEGIHPVDVVNPYDLRDPTRFDARLGVPAVSGLLHHRQAALELVYVPLFRPARLPAGIDLLEDADRLFDFSEVGGDDLVLGELETRTEVPDTRVAFAALAARASVATPLADLALVAYRGRDSLPQVGGEARLVGFATANDRVDVGIPVVYPTMTLLGLEARGAIGWEIVGAAEAALIVPERTVVTASKSQLEALVSLGLLDAVPDPLPETVTQDGRPFPRWVVGIDRIFGRFVVNGQWIHGLPTERRGAEVRDYASLAVVATVADPVQLRTFAVSDLQGWLLGASLAVLHRDAATVTAGLTWVDGPDGSALGQLREASRVSFGVEAAF